MKIIYVAGRFSAPTREGVEANILAAVDVALDVARTGGFPITPHANTAHPLFENLQPYSFWIEGTAELLRRSDALITVPGWEASSGARGEVELAHRLGKPVFHSIEELKLWLTPDDEAPDGYCLDHGDPHPCGSCDDASGRDDE